jgi:hypothetical protein
VVEGPSDFVRFGMSRLFASCHGLANRIAFDEGVDTSANDPDAARDVRQSARPSHIELRALGGGSLIEL